jgi:hypothetical protein
MSLRNGTITIIHAYVIRRGLSTRVITITSRLLRPYLCDKQHQTEQTIEYVAENSGIRPDAGEQRNEIDSAWSAWRKDGAIQESYPDLW